MKRFLQFLCIFTFFSLLTPIISFAQDIYEDEDIQGEHENGNPVRFITPTYNHEGDQFIKLGLNVSIPIAPLNPFDDGHLKIGGTGILGYHVFITPMFSAGADVMFGFNTTIGDNVFNNIPIMVVGTYHPMWQKFEFPISMGIGFAWETYNNYTYWPGLVIRPEVGVHYRIGDSWSLGVDTAYTFMPQFCKFWGTGDKNIWMQFLHTGVTARYFF